MTHSFTPHSPRSKPSLATRSGRRPSGLRSLTLGLGLLGAGLLAVTIAHASEPGGDQRARVPGLSAESSEPEALATTKKKASKSKAKPKKRAKKAPAPVESYGPFDAAAVKVALDQAAVASQACATDDEKGEAHLRILLTNRGVVQRVSLVKQDCSPSVAECVVQRFQALRVPPYDGKQRAVMTKVTLL